MAENEDDDGVGSIAIPAGAATETALGSLHGIVAEFLTIKLASGKATAAEVGAAITFLKNNSITADPAKNAALNKLNAALANRRTKGGHMTPSEMSEADRAFDAMMGSITPGGVLQ
jgi:hypothetical protein